RDDPRHELLELRVDRARITGRNAATRRVDNAEHDRKCLICAVDALLCSRSARGGSLSLTPEQMLGRCSGRHELGSRPCGRRGRAQRQELEKESEYADRTMHDAW